MEKTGDLAGGFDNFSCVNEMLEIYEKDPYLLNDSWRKFFEHLLNEAKKEEQNLEASTFLDPVGIEKLIDTYRRFGHLLTNTDPLFLSEKEKDRFSLKHFGFSEADLNQPLKPYTFGLAQSLYLKDLLFLLKQSYSGRIGVEFMGFVSQEIESWFLEKIEPHGFQIVLNSQQKKNLLECLNKSELFESFIHTKYTGQKRFSLEGAETLIPMLEAAVQQGAEFGASDVVIGMAHRGRLNVLSHILNKSYAEIFSEFEDGYRPHPSEGSGDVKYHKGFAKEVTLANQYQVKLVLAANPSHLESVDPVVVGNVFARQFLKKEASLRAKKRVVPLLIHGDAAISGQGVVYETLQLSQLEGFGVGGTLHFVINNHIGFTTSPKDLKSTMYCTDIAKTFSAPVFHVDAQDPEACVYVVYLAMELRQKFHIDVFINLNCYRKYGHNETDEPFYTQPLEYTKIRQKQPIRQLYLNQLIGEKVVDKKEAKQLEDNLKEALQKGFKEAKERLFKNEPPFVFQTPSLLKEQATCLPYEQLAFCSEKMCQIPHNFSLHPKLQALLKERKEMVQKDAEKKIDWGMAEMLAFSTLLSQGKDIRLSGQDSGRGTFSHRHAIWVDQKLGEHYCPLQFIQENQGHFSVINSPLSEFAVLGFEYGYSLAHDRGLVIWEAQFGDFANGAQVVIDQFLVNGEKKWGMRSGLVLMLPHGYEGQGPEHSSARLERFLSLCANENLQVVYPTTPAQLFHVLRRQGLEKRLKPLILMTPKALLRHPLCLSSLEDFTEKNFFEWMVDDIEVKGKETLVVCTGKIYYDLIKLKEQKKALHVSILRIEQLYPLDERGLEELFDQFSDLKKCLWVQEEPQNMGAFGYIEPFLRRFLKNRCSFSYVGRQASASTAAGSYAIHRQEVQEIQEALF